MNKDFTALTECINAPVGKINQDYKKQPSNPRKCIECGRMHDTIIEDTTTGERIEETDKCKFCLIFGPRVKWGGPAKCITSDGRNVNMAEEINKLKKEIIE